MPLFNGSLVDGMLSELAQRWTAAPDCAEPCNVGDVRFHLEVIADERRHASGKAACKRHAVVLSDEVHLSAVATLRRR